MAEMDREKVIKAIETHISTDDSVGCDDCTYENDGWCMTRVFSDALALLKEQEAVIPYIDIDEAKCPICKVKLTRQELIGDNILFEDFFDYCPHCGRRVKWE